MSVLSIKPHILQYLTVITPSYEDTNGDLHEAVTGWQGNLRCDAVPNGKANERAFEDGTISSYAYTVYLDAGCREFRKGERVKILFYNGKVSEFEVKGFHRYQLQSKLWV